MQRLLHRDSQGCRRPKARDLEDAARATLDSLAGRCLTDAEWMRARAKLVEFMSILRTWDQQAKTSNSRTDNVVVMPKKIAGRERVQEEPCQREH